MSLIDTSGLAHYDEEYVQPIMDSIAPTESGSTSAHDYAIGQEFYHDNLLYKAKTAITTGDMFVVGTNIELAQDIATQISNAGGGGIIDTTWQDYQALPEQQKLDPGKVFFIDDLDLDYDNLRDIVAPTEAATAVGGHSTGDEFILGDYLYKAISAIAQGDPIVTSGTGQNAALAGTIVDQIKALFDDEKLLKDVKLLTTGDNLNNLAYVKPCLRYYIFDSNAQNIPVSDSGYLLDMSFNANGSFQVAFMNNSSEAVYIRRKTGGTWDTAWKQIYPQSYRRGLAETGNITISANSYKDGTITLTSSQIASDETLISVGVESTGTAGKNVSVRLLECGGRNTIYYLIDNLTGNSVTTNLAFRYIVGKGTIQTISST